MHLPKLDVDFQWHETGWKLSRLKQFICCAWKMRSSCFWHSLKKKLPKLCVFFSGAYLQLSRCLPRDLFVTVGIMRARNNNSFFLLQAKYLWVSLSPSVATTAAVNRVGFYRGTSRTQSEWTHLITNLFFFDFFKYHLNREILIDFVIKKKDFYGNFPLSAVS